jgi:hypothetical protein
MKGTPFVAIGDPHGDQVCPVTSAALFDFMADFKPVIRLHLGDNWDFRNLRKGASDDEKAASLMDDWEAGTDFMRRFFAGGKVNHFLRGNHDERIYHFRESCSGVLRDYASDAVKRLESVVRQSKATMLPYDSRHGILRLGEMKCVHGYAAGKNALSRHAAIYGQVILGHIHTAESYPVESDQGPKEARSIGCICKTDMSYNQHQPNKLRHRNGWASGLMFDDGTYQIHQTIRINDQFHAPSSYKTY